MRISDWSSDVCSSDLNYKTIPDWASEARKLTDGRGVDHVIEVGGADTFMQSIMAIRLGGHIAVIGLLSGMTKDMNVAAIFSQNRSEERRVGKECVSTCRSRWSPSHSKKKTIIN